MLHKHYDRDGIQHIIDQQIQGKSTLLGAVKTCLQGTGRSYRALKQREQLEGYIKNSVER